MEETWKDIKNYENKYLISNLGNVRSLKDGWGNKQNKYLKKLENKQGYYFVILSKNGIEIAYLISRLVAQVYIPNPKNKPQVNHIDGNPKNNNINNLEWVTASENKKHAYRIGLISSLGEKNGNSKFKEKDIKLIRNMFKTNKYTYREMAIKFNRSYTNIYQIINKVLWKHI